MGDGLAAPVVAADGTVSISLFVAPTYKRSCTVTGIALEDGAGDVAAYGPVYGGSAIGLTATQIPDSAPPVISSVSLDRTSIPLSELPTTLTVTAQVSSSVGVNGYTMTIFDATGLSVGGSSGGLHSVRNGPVSFSANLNSLTAGVYTAAFYLTDNGGLHTTYGWPNQPPPPAGYLAFTVTDD